MAAYYEGQTDRPPVHVLDKICQALGVSADELLGLKKVEGEAPINLRIWRRFRLIEDLSPSERHLVWKFIVGLPGARKVRKRG